jgi:hypothetical protein
MIEPTAETWTLTQAAAHIGAGSPASARVSLRRWGVKPTGREPGRGGESLYDAHAVRAAKAARPGRGARTDIDRRTAMSTSYTNDRLRSAQRQGARITADTGITRFSITANLTWDERADGDRQPWVMYDDNGEEMYRWSGKDCFPVWPKEGEPPAPQPAHWDWNPGVEFPDEDPTI